MRWAAHVALWGRGECIQGFGEGKLKEGDHVKVLGAEENIILKLALKR